MSSTMFDGDSSIRHDGSMTSTAEKMLNVSAYKFVRLDRLPDRKLELKTIADALALKGTILLSPEGINIFLSGYPDQVHRFFDHLRQDPLFSDVEPKESLSPSQPFRRMLVRLKKEIIAFGISEIQPDQSTSPKLKARELKRWLDEGREVVLLDTRNDYEIELGTFREAQELNIHHFRDFPAAIHRLPEHYKEKTIVMFCTGGIRCEKAGPLMQQAGFEHVYQLDGGILKYFEEVGGDHWEGSCFVFDNRVALDPQLQPTGDQLCFACQAVLRVADLESPLYKLGEHCPYCYVSPEQRLVIQKERRAEQIRCVAQSQPGSQPYDNYRYVFVARKFSGLNLIDFLDLYQPNVGKDHWLSWIERGEVTHLGRPVRADQKVREGQQFEHHQPNTIEPPINPNIELLHEDESLVIVNKPAPLPMHPSGRFNRNSLVWILEQAYTQQKLRVAHRLDANTSGVAVLCRKAQSSRYVQPQFAAGRVDKVYWARVHGHPDWKEVTCRLPIGDEPAIGGSRVVSDSSHGLPSVTRFVFKQHMADGTSLIEAHPETGRTHQIRLHAWSLGHAVVGDPLYLRDGAIGCNRTLEVSEPPMCLHSVSISFCHPETKKTVTYSAPLPNWATHSLEKAGRMSLNLNLLEERE